MYGKILFSVPVDYVSSEVDCNWWDLAEGQVDIRKLVTVFFCGTIFKAI